MPWGGTRSAWVTALELTRLIWSIGLYIIIVIIVVMLDVMMTLQYFEM